MNWSEKRKLASDLNLEDGEFLALPDEVLDSFCNGIGAEWMPKKLREMIGKLHPSLEIVADIHDIGYLLGKGTNEDFTEKNEKFKRNAKKVARHLYGWYSPRRYLVICDGKRFGEYCQLGGKVAYYAAIVERERYEERHGVNLSEMLGI